MTIISYITSQLSVRVRKNSTICEFIRQFSAWPLMVRLAYNHNQPGDAKKGASFVADAIKDEGVTKER
jgi:hypothetical protein